VISPEEIPDGDQLYYRVHANFVLHTNGKLGPNCFKEKGGNGLSADWSKYSTPERTRNGMGVEKAANYGIVSLPVGVVRRIEALTVVHAPRETNDAHSLVQGLSTGDELLTQQRAELYDACGRAWLIAPGR
jgi:hypothetical protein